ncbi:nitroreductase family protein [Paenibacillus contaminans]|uniref:Nitroreductase family protein n=1 Tax=Paenibacillus contaminans TaxID=450362 RepID=A0A329MR07_9BACL|nr:nitroreductase family protein [Paenibacillus contaminans]RAV20387.1 nitroreductase family protein [Paenibacillus contaminans]
MELNQLLEQRISVNNFDPAGQISREQLESIIQAATSAPSAYNLQHWHFLAVTDKDRKLALKQAAYNQQKIEDAAAAVVVLGDLKAFEKAGLIADDLSAKGYLPEAYKDNLINTLHNAYSNESTQREEAIRAASFAAMTLMLAAKNDGFGTCPMTGFDPQAVRETFNIPAHLFPVLIVTIGQELEETRPQKFRQSVEQVTTFNGF